MSRGNNDDEIELVVRIRGLTITVVGPPAQATDFVAEITSGRARASSPSSSTTRSFSLVSGASQAPTSRRETRQEIADSFAPCPGRLLDTATKIGGGRDFFESRIKRAFLAGQWAGAVLAGRAGSPNRSEQLALRPRVYVVLRAAGLVAPTVVFSSADFFRIVGNLQTSDSVSHSFPSETEARAYCEGAGVPYPEREQ